MIPPKAEKNPMIPAGWTALISFTNRATLNLLSLGLDRYHPPDART